MIKNINKTTHKIGLIIGFLGKSLSREQKVKLIEKVPEYFGLIEANIK